MNTSTRIFEFLNGMTFNLPVQWVALVLGFLALCLIWGRFKLGLMVGFGSFVYWGVRANLPNLLYLMDGNVAAVIGGILVAISMSFLILNALLDESL